MKLWEKERVVALFSKQISFLKLFFCITSCLTNSFPCIRHYTKQKIRFISSLRIRETQSNPRAKLIFMFCMTTDTTTF
jgi:hypothetical protein